MAIDGFESCHLALNIYGIRLFSNFFGLLPPNIALPNLVAPGDFHLFLSLLVAVVANKGTSVYNEIGNHLTSKNFKMAALEKFRDEDRGCSEVQKVIKGSYNCYMLTCISYVRFSQAAEGTIKTLSEVLKDMRRGDVLDILEGRHDSGFDSGFGSQSLSFNKSEGNVCASIDLELKDVIFGPLGLLQQFSNCKLLKGFLSYLGSPHWY